MAKISNEKLPGYAPNWKIVNIAKNPKRVKANGEPCAAWYDYEVMVEGMTLVDHAAALKHKKAAAEISWNWRRGYISLMDTEGNVYTAELPVDEAEAVDAE